MAFKLKDLFISLLPHGEAPACPPQPLGLCAPLSAHVVFCRTASPPIIILPECARTAGIAQECARTVGVVQECARTVGLVAEAGGAQNLAALKQQLQHALAQVEEQERAQAGSHMPQTLEEAEDLEARLRGALEELQQHKNDLKKKG